MAANRNVLLGYGISEEIVHFKRRWFVINDDSLDMLVRLLSHPMPIEDVTITHESPDKPIESE